MRKQRILAQGAWYEVWTVINNRKPLFQEQKRAKALLYGILREAKDLFTFEMRGISLGAIWLSFYIKPADGFRLPEIIQWLKQTFAARFNRRDGRTGHLWGNRYWSCVLEGEPSEEAAAVDWEAEAEPPTAVEAGRGQAPSGGEGGGTPVFTRNPPPPRTPALGGPRRYALT